MSPAAPALALHDVHFRYGDAPLLDGVSLEVAAGEMVGLLGRNGCGKTTALRLITGTRRPQSGAVRVGGRDRSAWGRRELARRLALVPQELQVAFDFTAEELVLLGRGPHVGWLRGHTRADTDAARAAMRAVGIEGLASRPYRQLVGRRAAARRAGDGAGPGAGRAAAGRADAQPGPGAAVAVLPGAGAA